jgi:hypothetical protein
VFCLAALHRRRRLANKTKQTEKQHSTPLAPDGGRVDPTRVDHRQAARASRSSRRRRGRPPGHAYRPINNISLPLSLRPGRTATGIPPPLIFARPALVLLTHRAHLSPAACVAIYSLLDEPWQRRRRLQSPSSGWGGPAPDDDLNFKFPLTNYSHVRARARVYGRSVIIELALYLWLARALARCRLDVFT